MAKDIKKETDCDIEQMELLFNQKKDRLLLLLLINSISVLSHHQMNNSTTLFVSDRHLNLCRVR